jgi:hypothetical protein
LEALAMKSPISPIHASSIVKLMFGLRLSDPRLELKPFRDLKSSMAILQKSSFVNKVLGIR